MRKYLVALAFIGAVLAGCAPYALNLKGYSYKEESLYDAWYGVASKKYIRDFGEYWFSPMEFDAKGGGDCEDFAIALVYRLGRDASFVCVLKPDGCFHVIVKYQGRFLEPQRFGLYYEKQDLNILWVMDYDETMSLSTLWGTKFLKNAPELGKDSCTAAPLAALGYRKVLDLGGIGSWPYGTISGQPKKP